MPTLSSEAFKKIYFLDSKIGLATVDGQTLTIPIKNVDLLGAGFPLNQGPMFSGTMVFSGVSRSVRTMSEYVGGDPRGSAGFKPSYDVIDIDAASTNPDTQTFGIEGVGGDPLAWIDWTVIAESVEFIESN